MEQTGPAYRTGVATNEAQYEAIWRRAGVSGERPAVDFSDEIVIWFGSVFGGGCEHRLDDVIVDLDQALVHGRFAVPGPPASCNADANPNAYVVAVKRSHLPTGPFAVQLGSSEPAGGAPEERTLVEADLTVGGSVATDDEIGFDPALVDEPWRIDLTQRGDTVEPGWSFTYTLRSDCSLNAVGPINGRVWEWIVDVEWTGTHLPPEWASLLETPYDPLVVEGVIDADEATLTFTSANGHSERFVPAPPGTYSDCH